MRLSERSGREPILLHVSLAAYAVAVTIEPVDIDSDHSNRSRDVGRSVASASGAVNVTGDRHARRIVGIALRRWWRRSVGRCRSRRRRQRCRRDRGRAECFARHDDRLDSAVCRGRSTAGFARRDPDHAIDDPRRQAAAYQLVSKGDTELFGRHRRRRCFGWESRCGLRWRRGRCCRRGANRVRPIQRPVIGTSAPGQDSGEEHRCHQRPPRHSHATPSPSRSRPLR
jgi:hypothetical protein